MRRLISLMGLACVVSVALLVPSASAQTDTEPRLTSSLTSADFGDQIAVRGEGWTPNTVINVMICGNDALNGTSDCDIVNGRVIGVSNRGTFGVSLAVGQPPVPCPCVVRAESQTAPELFTFALTINGAPELSADEQFQVPVPDRQLAISNARIDGNGPWYSYFGAPAKRKVVFTVDNIGEVTVRNAAISLSIGKGPNPKGFVAAPDLGEIKPGESRTFAVDVELPVMAVGTYGVQGNIPGFADPVRFRTETSQVPWALTALPLLILGQVALLTMRNRLRRKLAPVPAPVPAIAPRRALPAAVIIDLDDLETSQSGTPERERVTVGAAAATPPELVPGEIGESISRAVRDALDETSIRVGDSEPDQQTLVRIIRNVSRVAALRVGVQHSLTTHQVDHLEAEILESLTETIGAAAPTQPVGS